jgi:6-phosphofructokinase 1
LGKETEAEAPHLVYLPEVPFEESRFLADIARIQDRLGYVFVVVSEGIRDTHGEFVGQRKLDEGDRDALGRVVHALTMGVAAYLTKVVRDALGLQARFLRPGLIGRAMSACASDTDRQEAWRVGREAVAQLARGNSGYMVTLARTSNAPYICDTGLAPLQEVANAERRVPRSWVNDAGNMVTRAFFDYAMPLIDGPLPPLARLQGTRLTHRIS